MVEGEAGKLEEEMQRLRRVAQREREERRRKAAKDSNARELKVYKKMVEEKQGSWRVPRWEIV